MQHALRPIRAADSKPDRLSLQRLLLLLLLLLQGPWMSRQALHAVSLTLLDPHSGQPLTFVAPPPEDFAAAAAALGLTVPNIEDLQDLSAKHYTQVN
jgi:hypothetical protein